MTLESVAYSPKLQKEIFKQAAKQSTAREAILKNRSLKIKWDTQGKHIPGRHNYELGKGIFEHPDPQRLVNKFAGKGQKKGTRLPGEPGYKEVVDFDEFIGYYCDKETRKLYPTTIGSVDYAKDGVHIIPRKPRNFNL